MQVSMKVKTVPNNQYLGYLGGGGECALEKHVKGFVE